MKRKSKTRDLVRTGGEGSYRGPAYGVGEFGGVFAIPWGDGFQRGLEMMPRGGDARLIPAAYAAVMANAKAVSQCYARHKRIDPVSGKHEVVTTSPASRILRRPNSYQTWPQYILNQIATMQFEGESFSYATRDDRFAINGLHPLPPRSSGPWIEPTERSVYYAIGQSDLFYTDPEYMVPARDILHLRQYCPRDPLIGESPIKAAALAAGINVALSKSQEVFFNQMRRPSGILSSDQFFTKVQIQRLREAFDEQAKGMAQGNMPILGGGLKFVPMGINSVDSQLVQVQRLSIEDLARVVGVPLPIIGDLSHATLNNVEALVNMWLAISLGALLENIERSLDALFQLPMNEYIELDTSALLRTDFVGRINGLAKGLQTGLYTPNEARDRENLAPVPHGDVPYVQQQMVPLGTLPAANTAGGGSQPAADEPPEDPEEDTPPEAGDGNGSPEDSAKELTIMELRSLGLTRMLEEA